MIFDEDLEDFVEALKKSLTKFKELKEPKDGKTYSVEKIRETHKQAYCLGQQKTTINLNCYFVKARK
jgi:hypothetical protein